MAKNTEHVILGMLAFEPMSGYAIRQAIRQSVALFWSESDGQLYPALKRLLNQGEIKIVLSDAGLPEEALATFMNQLLLSISN